MTGYSEGSYEAIADLKQNVIKLVKNKGIISSFIVTPPSNVFEPPNTNHVELVRFPTGIKWMIFR